MEDEAFRAVLQGGARERKFLYQALAQLAESPFQNPDWRDASSGREYLTRFCGSFTITYWLDHAVSEVRVALIYKG